MSNLFIIAGCNGAGKTTASFTVLPELLHVNEFVNADEIARGLSPFQPEKVAIEAGKIMLRRIDELLEKNMDFAFETTLSTRSFVLLVDKAKKKGYKVILIFFWLDSPELAVERVKIRVEEGGHSIPTETIFRRYSAGIRNLLNLYLGIVDQWLIYDSSNAELEMIGEGFSTHNSVIYNQEKWQMIRGYEETNK